MILKIKTSAKPVEYEDAMKFMESTVDGIITRTKPETLWFLEHPPLYTAGTSAKNSDLIDKNRFPVFKTGRGGEYTYHGPGQRVVYVMLDLKKHYKNPDLKKYVYDLEEWIIQTLNKLGVKGGRRDRRVGIWVTKNGKENKIAALGIRVRKWVAYHGISLNINPDLSHFDGIVPCGIKEYGITSLEKLDIRVEKEAVDKVLQEEFKKIF